MYFLFSLVISYLIRWLFRTVLFPFHTFMNFPNFLQFLISDSIPLLSENVFCMISIIFKLSRLDVWPKICSFLESIPWALGNICSAIVGWNILADRYLKIVSVRPGWFQVFSKPSVSLLIFYLVLSIIPVYLTYMVLKMGKSQSQFQGPTTQKVGRISISTSSWAIPFLLLNIECSPLPPPPHSPAAWVLNCCECLHQSQITPTFPELLTLVGVK